MTTPIHLQQFVRLAQYNRWFNGQLYDVAGRLSEEERQRDLGAFFGSLHGTLDHILLTDRLWLGRFERSELALPSLDGASLVYRVDGLDQGVEPDDFDRLRREREATDGVIERFVRDLDESLLAADLAYHNSKGQPFTSPVWQIVTHLFNHQTHHRGQATTLLHQLGHDPGMTDFLVTTVLPYPD